MDFDRWVGTDEHSALPSLVRPDAPRSRWSLEAITATERPTVPPSPNGSTVAFVLHRDTSDVWTVPVSGGHPTRVTTDRGVHVYWWETRPAWSPDGAEPGRLARRLDIGVHLRAGRPVPPIRARPRVADGATADRRRCRLRRGVLAPRRLPCDCHPLRAGTVRPGHSGLPERGGEDPLRRWGVVLARRGRRERGGASRGSSHPATSSTGRSGRLCHPSHRAAAGRGGISAHVPFGEVTYPSFDGLHGSYMALCSLTRDPRHRYACGASSTGIPRSPAVGPRATAGTATSWRDP